MQSNQKELLLARIRCGYHIYKGKDITLYIHHPTKEQNYEAQLVFAEAYEEAYAEENMVEEELLEMLEDQGFWNETIKERLEEIDKQQDILKKQIFELFFEPRERELKRLELNELREESAQILSNKHSYDFLTCEGIATFAKSIWLIENTTKLPDGSDYDWEEISPTSLLTQYKKAVIPETQYRELARTTPWRSFWNCNKSCSGVFEGAASDLTTEQVSLMSFSLMYDNIYQSTECPPDEIVEDDDAIDGWLLLQREKQSKSQKEKLLEKLHSKHKSAKDIFVAAKDYDDAKRINNLNSDYSQHIKKSRVKQLSEAEGGELHHYKFNDIQKDLKDEIMEAGMM